jgi:hypothetical protein
MTEARRLPAALGLVLCLALAAALSGCGLFDTAEPQPPTSIGGPPPDFTLPESLMVTLERAIENKSPSNYALCFADTLSDQKGFHASFDPADLLDYQTSTGQPPPADWTTQQENSFFNQFIGTLSGNPQVHLLPDERGIIVVDATRQIWNRKFRVFVGQSAATASAPGIQIERVNLAGDWKITHWEDRRDTTGVPSYGTRRLNGR